MSPSLRPAGLAALLSLATAACATTAPTGPSGHPAPTVADTHRIKVEQVDAKLQVSIADGVLADETLREIEAFATEYRLTGHGPMTMSAPSGARSQMVQTVRAYLDELGVIPEAISFSTYDTGGPGAPLLLGFVRYEAEAPACPSLGGENLAISWSNKPWSGFGCATQANLAAMIADPADLMAPRATDPADATRRAVVLERYRQGGQTHATRSSDERVSVSAVAK
ncbi:MAG: CpaD family pilus assembly lipoprotein [Alphaproteobacteria bacterium]|nr:CpaD family pilus assembly lipoprotein [Alphaproteobacteria bacterium]